MAEFSVKPGEISIPLKNTGTIQIRAIDMNFENYPPPFNRLNSGSKFSAQIPKSSRFIIYHGMKKMPEILPAKDAFKLGYLPISNNKFDFGATSINGYYLVPQNWYLNAKLFDNDYNLIPL